MFAKKILTCTLLRSISIIKEYILDSAALCIGNRETYRDDAGIGKPQIVLQTSIKLFTVNRSHLSFLVLIVALEV